MVGVNYSLSATYVNVEICSGSTLCVSGVMRVGFGRRTCARELKEGHRNVWETFIT